MRISPDPRVVAPFKVLLVIRMFWVLFGSTLRVFESVLLEKTMSYCLMFWPIAWEMDSDGLASPDGAGGASCPEEVCWVCWHLDPS